MGANLSIDMDKLFEGLKNYERVTEESLTKALNKAGIQLLTWIINGSPRVDRTPPLKTGMLRGSGSAIVNGKSVYTGGSLGYMGTPAIAKKNERDFEILIHFNTPYADHMENGTYNLGKFSAQAKNAGSGFIAMHLAGDGEAITRFIARSINRDLKK